MRRAEEERRAAEEAELQRLEEEEARRAEEKERKKAAAKAKKEQLKKEGKLLTGRLIGQHWRSGCVFGARGGRGVLEMLGGMFLRRGRTKPKLFLLGKGGRPLIGEDSMSPTCGDHLRVSFAPAAPHHLQPPNTGPASVPTGVELVPYSGGKRTPQHHLLQV